MEANGLPGFVERAVGPMREQANGHAEEIKFELVKQSKYLEKLFEEITAERAAAQYRWIFANGATGATGDVSIDLGRPPRGSAWLVKLFTTTTGSVTGGGFAVYFNEQVSQSLVFAGDNDPAMNTELPEIYIPESTRLIARLFNLGGANIQCTVGMQVKQLILNPRMDASPVGVAAQVPGME